MDSVLLACLALAKVALKTTYVSEEMSILGVSAGGADSPPSDFRVTALEALYEVCAPVVKHATRFYGFDFFCLFIFMAVTVD